ncbi:MAG: VOC family protein [Ilumatobacter sp.]|nr:VOC family protein [Ilumatobacter sp.]
MSLANVRIDGVHHLAISTADIKGQIEFFSDVLGAELVALFWMHGVPGGWHGFCRLNDHCSVAFVQLPRNAEVEPEVGRTHAGSGAGSSAPGTMQHVAFRVGSFDELMAMRDRIRSRGVNVIGHIDHGMCQSIYFAGPEGLTLEIATSDEALNPGAWIDPEVVELAGITPEELERFRRPAEFAGEGGSVPQPPMDPAKPHLHYPPDRYAQVLAMSDEAITALSSFADPPVKV